MIEVILHIPDMRDSSVVCGPVAANVQSLGYTVEARFAGWGRNRDGSVSVDIEASVRSPAGLTAVLR
jgi:hypothetical protein